GEIQHRGSAGPQDAAGLLPAQCPPGGHDRGDRSRGADCRASTLLPAARRNAPRPGAPGRRWCGDASDQRTPGTVPPGWQEGPPLGRGARTGSWGSVLPGSFDAGALVKRYAVESGSTAVRRWLATDAIATSRSSEVEVASAVVRRSREGAFSARERDRAL